jgi:hypothetical protein
MKTLSDDDEWVGFQGREPPFFIQEDQPDVSRHRTCLGLSADAGEGQAKSFRTTYGQPGNPNCRSIVPLSSFC